jgi:hypothetical protein
MLGLVLSFKLLVLREPGSGGSDPQTPRPLHKVLLVEIGARFSSRRYTNALASPGNRSVGGGSKTKPGVINVNSISLNF